MALRAAIASTDGKVVNRHFGRAEYFYIVELTGGKFQYVEKRDVNPACLGGDHSIGAFDETAKILSDCSVIIVSHIGVTAAQFLEARGFTVYEAPFPISDVLEKLKSEIEVE